MARKSYDDLLADSKTKKKEIESLNDVIRQLTDNINKLKAEKAEQKQEVFTQFDLIKALKKFNFSPADLGWCDYQKADFVFDGENVEFTTIGGQKRKATIIQIREHQL